MMIMIMIMKGTLRILLAVFIILLSTSAFAATYYVSPSGDDRNSGTDPSTPWRHCPGMTGWGGSVTLTAGDTVLFRSQDTWQITPAAYTACLSTTAGVTYDGASYGSGTRAKLTLSGTYQTSVHIVQIRDSNVTFKGFEVDCNGYRSGGIWIEATNGEISNIEVSNCIIHNNYSTGTDGWQYLFILNDAGHIVDTVNILNNTISDSWHEALCVYPTGTGGPVSNVTIRGNTIYNAGMGTGQSDFGNGILLKNRVNNITIEFNYFHDCKSSGIGFDSAQTSYAATGITIRYNVFKANAKGQDAFPNGQIFDVDFYGNLFIDNTSYNVYLGSHDFSTGTWKYYNNTFYSSSGTSNFIIDAGATGTPTMEFKNNIAYSVNNIPLEDRKNWFTHNNNLYYRTSASTATHVYNGTTNYNREAVKMWEPTAQNTDPTFKNESNLPTGFNGTYATDMTPNTDGLSISSGSAISNGTNLGSLYNGAINFSGTNPGITRPQGSGWDIGAYQTLFQKSTPNAPGLHIIFN